jgi:hypothetical protein
LVSATLPEPETGFADIPSLSAFSDGSFSFIACIFGMINLRHRLFEASTVEIILYLKKTYGPAVS